MQVRFRAKSRLSLVCARYFICAIVSLDMKFTVTKLEPLVYSTVVLSCQDIVHCLFQRKIALNAQCISTPTMTKCKYGNYLYILRHNCIRCFKFKHWMNKMGRQARQVLIFFNCSPAPNLFFCVSLTRKWHD